MKFSRKGITTTIIGLACFPLWASGTTLSGKIQDQSGSPVPGLVVKTSVLGATDTVDYSGSFKVASTQTISAETQRSASPASIRGEHLYFQNCSENILSAKVIVCDIRGRQISTVFNGKIENGAYRVSPLSGLNLSKGVYLVRLTLGHISSAYKMVSIGKSGGSSSLERIGGVDQNTDARKIAVQGSTDTISVFQSGELVFKGSVSDIVSDNGNLNIVIQQPGVIESINHDYLASGDGKVVKEETYASSNGLEKRFGIIAPDNGMYNVTLLVTGSQNSIINIYLEGKLEGQAVLKENGIQTVSAKTLKNNGLLTLVKGVNNFSFRLKDSKNEPLVAMVRIGATSEKASIDISNLLAQYRGSDKLQITNQTLSKMAYLKGDPLYDYASESGLQFAGTQINAIWLNAGQTVTIETRDSPDGGNPNPVMWVWNNANPSTNGSWSSSGGTGSYGQHPRITFTAIATGPHKILVADENLGYSSHCDIYVDGIYFARGNIYGVKMVVKDHLNTGLLNYFTCNSQSNNQSIFLHVGHIYGSSSPIAYPGKIMGWNTSYAGSGDFVWGKNGRVKKQADATKQVFCIVSGGWNMVGTGVADLYMNNEASTIGSSFENLKADDAIKSADESSSYNCISWSGGCTTLGRFFWPPDPSCPNNSWYDPDPKTAFDKFYGNNPIRFSGSMTYVPTTNLNESVVDLWGFGVNDYTHGSVKRPGDNMTHGYDWESKPGGLMRTFHPRNALRGFGYYDYGDVIAYYKQNSGLAKSFANGSELKNKIAEDISLNAQEQNKLNGLIKTINTANLSKLQLLYSSWKNTWGKPSLINASNPEMFFKSPEWNEFVNYCKQDNKAAMTLLLQECNEGDELAGRAICKLNLSGNIDKIMAEVRNDSEQGKITGDGFFIIEGPHNGWTRFIKKILSTL